MFIFALWFGNDITYIANGNPFNRIYIIKMNIKTNLIEEYVKFVDTTKKQIKCFKIIIFLSTFRNALFSFHVFFNI